MSREERERGKQIVQQMLADLCREKNIALNSPVVWHKDFDRDRYWLEVETDGRNVKWPLSYEVLEDCVADKSVRRKIESGLSQYVLSPTGKGQGEETIGIRCNPDTDPLVVLDFDCHSERPVGTGMRVVRDNEFILKNKGHADAINVQIQDIVFASGIATFRPVTEIAPGTECSITTTIPAKGNLLQHDWENVLMDEWNANGSLEDFPPVKVHVLYADYSGNQYHARFEVLYDVYTGIAETRFLDCSKSENAKPLRTEPPDETETALESPVERADVFISHASEDKPYVEPLVKALEDARISVWYDRITMEWGDDLRPAIDRGLANCRFGIVVFSKAFLAKKKWTEYELNALFARENAGKKVVLPIWHGVTRDDLLLYSPAFADRLAKISSSDDYDDIVSTLKQMLGKDDAQESGRQSVAEPHPQEFTGIENTPLAMPEIRLELSFELVPLTYRFEHCAWDVATQFDHDQRDALIAWFANPVPPKGASGVIASQISAFIKYSVAGHRSAQVTRGYWMRYSANEIRINTGDRAGLILGLNDWSHWVSYSNPYPHPANEEFLQPVVRPLGEKVQMPKADMDIKVSLLLGGTVTLDEWDIRLCFANGKPYAVKYPTATI